MAFRFILATVAIGRVACRNPELEVPIEVPTTNKTAPVD